MEKNSELPEIIKKEAIASIPIEDISVVLLDEKQITIIQALIGSLIVNISWPLERYFKN